MKNYNYAEEIIKDNYAKTFASPDDDIVNEQEQNKPVNSVDDTAESDGKEKAFEEGLKKNEVSIEEGADDTIDAGNAKE